MFAQTGMLDELEVALDRANATDVSALSPNEGTRAAIALERCKAKLAALDVKVCRKYETDRAWALEGALKPQGYLATAIRVPSKSFGRQFSIARRLAVLPAVEQALAAGEISPSHRDKILAVDNPRVHDALVADQETIVDWAKRLRWKNFEHALAEWLEEHDQDGLEPSDSEHNRAHWSVTFGGRGRVDADLDPISAALWIAEAERLERLEFEKDWAEAKQRLGREPKAHELRRRPEQRRAAAMVAMARRSAGSAGGTTKILLSIFAGVDWCRRLGELDNGTVIQPGQLLPWLDEVEFETFLFDTSFRNVTVSNQRNFRGALRRFALGRDRECAHKHCDTPANRCETDHEIAASRDGPTAAWNVTPRCPGHNRAKGNKDPTELEGGP